MESLIMDAARRAADYLKGMDNRRVGPGPDSISGLRKFNQPLQYDPIAPESVLEELDTLGSPATVASAGGRYFGFVIGGSLPAALAANILAGAWDQNAALEIAGPTPSALEKVSREWLISLLNLEAGTEVGFVTGATMANFTGLAAARHALLDAQGWDVESKGLFGAPSVEVIVGNEVHVSLLKALSLLGFGRERVVRVPVDAQGRIDAAAMPDIHEPAIVCLQAGNVNTGAFDPLEEICSKVRSANTWVHVDGAFGLWAAASPSRRHLIKGLEKADSLATDAHKWLNVPYDSGLVFVKSKRHLNAAMAASAAYLLEGETRDPHLFVPEMSRRGRGIEIWAALRSLGRRGLAEMIDRCCEHAQRMAKELSAAGYEILNEVVLNQVLVSFGSPELTRKVITGIQQDGVCWCGGTEWQGRTAMRISISSWATTNEDIDKSLESIIRVAGVEKKSANR
jgi:glutamate/tyrosine decarboxylase-like PLP-dependent enzyme